MIYIFKTSVRTRKQVDILKPYINDLLPNGKWNFDLQDRDRILRIETEENSVGRIVDLLSIHKFNCEELE